MLCSFFFSCFSRISLSGAERAASEAKKLVASGRFEDTNFVLHLSPFLVKNGSTVDEFQYVCLVVAITPPYAEINLVIEMIVLMTYTKKLGATYSEV